MCDQSQKVMEIRVNMHIACTYFTYFCTKAKCCCWLHIFKVRVKDISICDFYMTNSTKITSIPRKHLKTSLKAV